MEIKFVYIAGLGVIGGSFFKKLSLIEGCQVRGFDKNESFQSASGLSPEGISQADLILLCLPPSANLAFIKEHALKIKKGALLANCAGVQASAMDEAYPFCKDLGLHYLGAHPMAGSEKTGYEASRLDMFEGAPLILCPPSFFDTEILRIAEYFFKALGFGLIRTMPAQEHDQSIALVSQLPHTLAALLMAMQDEISASVAGGALKDMTRIAQFNAPLWAELFTSNKKELLIVIENFGRRLENFKSALKCGNNEILASLLEESSQKRSKFFSKGLDKK